MHGGSVCPLDAVITGLLGTLVSVTERARPRPYGLDLLCLSNAYKCHTLLVFCPEASWSSQGRPFRAHGLGTASGRQAQLGADVPRAVSVQGTSAAGRLSHQRCLEERSGHAIFCLCHLR